MAEQPRRKAPQQARTDFESMTHEQLAALLDSASSEGASHLATKLAKASSTITGIGDDLMTYVKGLEWQGDAGDTFRDWGGQSAAATLRLGQYAEVASRWMATVAQAVAEAKAAMPATSETARAKADLADARKNLAAAQDPGARNDPEARELAQTAQSDATAAQQRMEAARAEAVQQLRKLAQTYEYSAQQVSSVEPPTFAPPADHLESTEWRGPGRDVAPSGGPSSASTSSTGVDAPEGRSPAPATAPVGTYAAPSGGIPASHADQTPTRPAAMEIDGVASMPDSPSLAANSPVPPQAVTGSRADAGPTSQPVIVPPTLPGRGSYSPQQITPTSRPSLLPGQGTPAGGRLRVPGETGIVGGRPVAPGAGRPATGIPRGTVIGADPGNGRAAQSHAPMGRAMAPGVPTGGGTAAGQSGTGGARRLATGTGGVAANRPTQPGSTGARPFTPGGVGLVRQSDTGGSVRGSTGRVSGGPHSAPQSISRRDRRQDQGERPGYLEEEEETWARRDRRPVPPVVD
ncbi:hypothetical protein [Streptomyces edwardsiae]|uniref:Translation initiation factor IF-2 n=1 Tax=Streptomyces edwardsiae TaxID=3075527 RepID=A0ABU2QCY9_9ACTN|nr:hypothetical protein [Streptomyces sp. DSM 41635]MDT0402328.1 hypothetical protein [Streptomyces sp. DSM 41635]